MNAQCDKRSPTYRATVFCLVATTFTLAFLVRSMESVMVAGQNFQPAIEAVLMTISVGFVVVGMMMVKSTVDAKYRGM